MLAPIRTSQIAAILVAAICCAYADLHADEGLTKIDAAPSVSTAIVVGDCYSAAAEHFRNSRWQEAAAEYRKLLAADTKHPLAGPARFYLAESLVQAGDHQAAAEAWLNYLDGEPDPQLEPAARFRAGECCYLADRRPEATRELKKFVADHGEAPTIPRALLYLGNLAAADGDFAGAAKHFERSVKDFPNDELRPQAVLGHAQALLRAGEVRAAWNVVEGPYVEQAADDAKPTDVGFATDIVWVAAETLERLGRDEDALNAAKRFLVICEDDDPRRFDALLLSARLLERLKKPAEAAAAYQSIVDEAEHPACRDIALYELAWLLRSLERGADGVAMFAKLAADHPQSPLRADALYRLAEADLEQDRMAAAAAKLQEAAKIAGDELRPHVLLLQARTALALQRREDAEAALTELAKKHPKHPLAEQSGFWKAELLFQAGDFDSAADAFAALTKTTPDAKDRTWYATARLREVQALAEAGRWGDVLTAVEVAKREIPQADYEFDFLAGRAHTARAELAEARAAFERVVADDRARDTETAATAQFLAGETYFHQRNFEAALREYRRCAAEHKQPAWQSAALLQAGKCQEYLGHLQDAQATYDRLIADFAKSPYAADAQARRDAAVRQAEAAGGTVQRK
ncbi:MAG: tetratricopeptide repeat protein [Planctomycetaceae bacterium]|nr:tetratricopeptide repeat protein [Planctomycetaceae bacterium]